MRERAAIYARYSSHNQREESIEIQLEADRAYAAENDLEVVAEYCDYAQTGRNSDRAQFQRMMNDARRGLFDAVIIYKVTRIMRNRDEMAMTRLLLRKCGVEILYAGEDIPDGASGTLMLGFLEVLAEWESDLDSERIRDGVAKNARDLKASGNYMFGYDVGRDGRYVVNEREAAGVRLAYDRFCAGTPVAQIVREMQPWPTKRGGRWRQQSVTKLLKRPQYYGLYRYAGVESEGGMPAIISKEQWDDAQRRFSAISHVRPHDETFALTGKLYHGPCGEPMVGKGGTSHTGKAYHYYKCRKCGKSVQRDATEAAVAEAVIEVLKSPSAREKVADLMMEYQGESAPEASQSDLIRKELKEIEVTYGRIWSAIESGIAPPGGQDRISGLKERQETLEQELRTAEAVESVEITREVVLSWLERVGSMDVAEIIRTFVSRVWVVDGDLRIVFNFDEREGASGDPGGVRLDYTTLHQDCSRPTAQVVGLFS
jgi:site-specific DNA recombinase